MYVDCLCQFGGRFLSVWRNICLSIYLFYHLACLSITFKPICLSVHKQKIICLSNIISVCQFAVWFMAGWLPIHWFVLLSNLSVCSLLHVYLSVSLGLSNNCSSQSANTCLFRNKFSPICLLSDCRCLISGKCIVSKAEASWCKYIICRR